MSDEFRIANELNPVEEALSGLKPRGSRIDRDRLLYLAGQAAAEAETPLVPALPRRNLLWPFATLVSTAAAIVFGILFVSNRGKIAPPDVQYVYVDQPMSHRALAIAKSAPIPRGPFAIGSQVSTPLQIESKVLRSRYPILTTDVDRLPPANSADTSGGSSPVTLHEMRQSLLPQRKTEPSKQSTGLRLFQWTWPSSQGDRL